MEAPFLSLGQQGLWPRSPQHSRGVVSRQAVLAMQATGAVWGELLGQVEQGVWQPLLQCIGILLSVVLSQAPGELLVVINGLVQLLHWGPWGREQLCSAGTQGPERRCTWAAAYHAGQRARLWSPVREGSFQGLRISLPTTPHTINLQTTLSIAPKDTEPCLALPHR